MPSLQEEAFRLKAFALEPLSLHTLSSRFHCAPSLAAISGLPARVAIENQKHRLGDVTVRFTIALECDGKWELSGTVHDDGTVFGDRYSFTLEVLVDGQPVTKRIQADGHPSAQQTQTWSHSNYDQRIVDHWSAISAGRWIARHKLGVGLSDGAWVAIAFPVLLGIGGSACRNMGGEVGVEASPTEGGGASVDGVCRKEY